MEEEEEEEGSPIWISLSLPHFNEDYRPCCFCDQIVCVEI